MPNWCAGTLRFRGKTENVMKFLNEGFNIYNERVRNDRGEIQFVCKMMDRIKKEELERGYGIDIDLNDDGEYVYISDTRRAFVEWDPTLGLWRNEMRVEYSKDGEKMLVILPVKQAWGFDYEDWIDISKKYDIDIHLFGWEQGMQFEDEIEIHSGEVVKSGGHDYINWYWECPNPFIGG